MIPTLPLALRNRLAETILAALHDADARRALAALTTDEGAATWLDGADARWTAPLTERARRASAALAGRPLHSPNADLVQALDDAAALFDAGLKSQTQRPGRPGLSPWLRRLAGIRQRLAVALRWAADVVEPPSTAQPKQQRAAHRPH